MAGRKLLDGVFPEDATLVHGTVKRDPRPPNPHAWVEWDNIVWEPVTDEVMPYGAFYALFRAVPERRYKRQELLHLTLKYEHWGPWHGS